MRFELLRLGCSVELACDYVATLQVEDRVLFSRIVNSLLSEKGEYAAEPYLIKGDEGEDLPVRGGLRVVHTLPVMPTLDRGLQVKLFKKIGALVEADPEKYLRLIALMGEVNMLIEESAGGLRGDYCLTKDWDIETYLKGFGFSQVPREQYSLLDNCIHLLGVYADLEPGVPVVLVNAKSFFSKEELGELFSQSVFSGIRLLMLETWTDSLRYELERKHVIDQHFLFEY